MTTNNRFRVHCALDAFEKAGDEHPMRIGGLVSTDTLDKQGEKIVQKGLDFSPFLSEGWFNDNHGQRTQDVVGYPTDASYVNKGAQLPNGKQAEANGWWAEGYLLNTDEGRKIWGLCNALSKSPRRLGFSIEGKVQQRSRKNPNTIVRATVKNVAVTHCPVNTGTEMNALVKAMTAGSAINNPGATPGEGFPLRAEATDRSKAPFGQEGGPDNQWEAGAKEELDPDETENLAGDQGDDPNNGGWAGVNPHVTAISPPRLPPGHIVKAGGFELQSMTETEFMESWTSAISNARSARGDEPSRLTKAEARIIVRSELPHLSESQVAHILAQAGS